jgi:hypothetical protein
MKRRIIGIFNSISDAKNALGQIKKESWNQTELIVIIGEKNENRIMENKIFSEMATENFLENPGTEPHMSVLWPGLKEEQLSGIGTVRIGHSSPDQERDLASLPQKLSETDLDFIGRELAAQKIVTLIEVEEQFLPKLRFIMAINSAELSGENI